MTSDTHLASLTDPAVIERLTGAKPAPKEPHAKDFVRAYADAIKAARKNGWTVEQIHAELTAAGVAIELHTLRKYVTELCGPVRQRRVATQADRPPAVQPPAAGTPAGTDDANPFERHRSLRRSLAGRSQA